MKGGNRTCHRVAQAGALAIVIVAGARDAAALSCVEEPEVVAPADGASEVPLNARIWGRFQNGRVRLIGPDGEVASEQRYFPLAGPGGQGVGLPVLVPSQLLLPQTRYQVADDRSRRSFGSSRRAVRSMRRLRRCRFSPASIALWGSASSLHLTVSS